MNLFVYVVFASPNYAFSMPLLTKQNSLRLLDKDCSEKQSENAEKKKEILAKLTSPNDFEIVKQIIAKDDPFIINLVLSQDSDIPDVSEGILNTEKLNLYWHLKLIIIT